MVEMLASGVEVGVRHERVLAHDEHGPQIAAPHGIGDLHGREPLGGGQRHAPGLLEDAADSRVLDRPVVGEKHGNGAHVAGALDVVLAAQGIEAGAAPAHVAGGQGEIDEREASVGAVRLLGDAHAPVEGRFSGLADDAGGPLDVRRRNAGERLLPLGRPLTDRLGDRVEVVHARGDELLVHESVADHDVQEGVVHGHVGAGAELQVHVGPAGELDGARVGHDEPRPVTHGGLHLESRDGMSFGGVRTRDENHVVFGDLIERIGEGTGAHGQVERRNRRGVAEPGAVVDVVGLQGRAGELLEQVVLLVGALGGRIDRHRVGAIRVAVVRQPLRSQIEGLVPARAPPAALAAGADSNEGMRETVLVLRVVPAVAALDAEPALVDRVIVGRVHVGDSSIADVRREPAANAAE